jgi:hypothetical protein
MRLPESRALRHTVALGRAKEGREVALGVRGRNLLVAGDPRSGKSWAAGLVSEQLVLLGYSLCIVDPEGDYASLDALPGVVAFGGAAHPRSAPAPGPVDPVSGRGYGVRTVQATPTNRGLRVPLSPAGEAPHGYARDTACLPHRASSRSAR